MNWNKIFSRYIKKDGCCTKKVTVICGLKFSRSILDIKTVLKCLEEKEHHIERRANRNLLLYVVDCLHSATDDDLFCLKSEEICYIFNNKVLKWGLQNFKDFILNSYWSLGYLLEFEKIDPQTSFYAQFAKRATQGEFLWKYEDKVYVILCVTMLFGEDNAVYIKKSGIENPNAKQPKEAYFTAKDSYRRFIDGQVVAKYIENKPFAEQKQILIDLLEYVFSKYTLPSGKLSEVLYDCHLNNFIIDTSGQFHFIDDDLVSKKTLDKKYVIDYMLQDLPELRYEICQHFGCKYTENQLIDATQREWKKLISKYFFPS